MDKGRIGFPSSTAWRAQSILDSALKPAAWILAVLIVLSPLFRPVLQIDFAALLIVICVFHLVQRGAKRPGRQRFANAVQAVDSLKLCCDAAYREDGFVGLQVIGMTEFNAWNAYEITLDWLADELQVKKITFEVAMLSREWLDHNWINPTWKGTSADDMATRILSYRERNRKRLQGLDWAVDVRRYGHMPMIHGILVNKKYLFQGEARWEEDAVMRAGDRSFELFTVKGGDGDKIATFQSWFNFCFGDKPSWYVNAVPGAIPPVSTKSLSGNFKQQRSGERRLDLRTKPLDISSSQRSACRNGIRPGTQHGFS